MAAGANGEKSDELSRLVRALGGVEPLPLEFGRDHPRGTQHFRSQRDEVQIDHEALSAAAILAAYGEQRELFRHLDPREMSEMMQPGNRVIQSRRSPTAMRMSEFSRAAPLGNGRTDGGWRGIATADLRRQAARCGCLLGILMRAVTTSSLLLFCLATIGSTVASDWKVGTSRNRITPEGPYWMGGYASRSKPSEGTLQDLFAKAMAIEDAQGERLVIVTMDLLVVPRDLAERVAVRVQREHGLTRPQLLLNCSHTHSGPEIRVYRESLHDIPSVYAKKMYQYVETLEDSLVDLVGRALTNLRPAVLRFNQDQATFAVNRRDNREADVPKLRAEGALRGAVDHDVPVLEVVEENGEKYAVLFGYACHNTVLSGYETCADYAGFAQQYLEESHPGMQAMFLMGAGGDQNPAPRRRLEYAKEYGKQLAVAVERALDGAGKTLAGPLRVALEYANVEFQPHADRATLERQLQSNNRYERWKADYLLTELKAGREIPRAYALPTQAVRFGNDLLLIAIAGETVVDYSLRAKHELENEGPAVWIAGYSNDVFGYLPSLRVLQEGGYEGGGHMVYTKFPGAFTETVEERVFAAVAAAVEKVRPEQE